MWLCDKHFAHVVCLMDGIGAWKGSYHTHAVLLAA